MYFIDKGWVILVIDIPFGVLLNIKNPLILLIINTNQTISAKVNCRKGNSPDYMIKYKNIIKYKNLKIKYSWEVSLEAAIL